MKLHLPAFLAAFLLCSVIAHGQNPLLPKVITDGFDMYLQEGSQKAFDSWLTGSPVEKDPTGKGSLVSGIAEIETTYGKYSGYEYLGVTPFSRKVRRFYFIALYERGPVYFWFEVYTKDGKDDISSLDYSTKANPILPASSLDTLK